MGWKLKVFAFIFALVAIPFGAWIIAIPLFIYVASGLFVKKPQSSMAVVVPQQAQAAYPVPYQSGAGAPKPGRPRGSSARYAVCALLAVLMLVALAEGGNLSPLVFGVPASLLLFWGPLSTALPLSRLKPERESILLRSWFFPFHWMAFASVKLSTKQVGKALACINERLLILAAEEVGVFVPVSCFSITHRRAEEAVLGRMRDITMAASPLGAWLLPLDSEQASRALRLKLQRLKFNAKNLQHSFSVRPYDVLSIETREGYVEKLGMYRRTSASVNWHVSVPRAGQILERRPVVWEVIAKVGEKVTWPGPDSYSAFLTSIAATKDMTPGERMEEAGKFEGGSEQRLLVKSMNGAGVEVSRAQLRAIMSIYCRPKS